MFRERHTNVLLVGHFVIAGKWEFIHINFSISENQTKLQELRTSLTFGFCWTKLHKLLLLFLRFLCMLFLCSFFVAFSVRLYPSHSFLLRFYENFELLASIQQIVFQLKFQSMRWCVFPLPTRPTLSPNLWDSFVPIGMPLHCLVGFELHPELIACNQTNSMLQATNLPNFCCTLIEMCSNFLPLTSNRTWVCFGMNTSSHVVTVFIYFSH